MNILVTGSSGLIGSSVAQLFLSKKAHVFGIDNNMRQKLFGVAASTLNQELSLKHHPNYHHYRFDIRNEMMIAKLFREVAFDLIIHTAAQPSHDKAKDIPELDFNINALGTLKILEMTRQFQPQAVFVFTSTNKVYGDNPNKVTLIETDTRYTYADCLGISEHMSVDQTVHSLFGASKLAADTYVQEYGRNFGLKTTVLRLGCVTGPTHASTQMHGFLSFLIKSLVHTQTYQVIGYKGKQVRDQIHTTDVAQAIHEIFLKPNHGEVFNLGGGLKNNASILELISIIEAKLNAPVRVTFDEKQRVGDHICYISDISKFESNYPNWRITKDLDTIVNEIIAYEQNQ